MTAPKDFHAVTSQLAAAAAQSDQADAAQHLRTLQSQIDAIARGDLEAVLEHARDDVVLTIFVPPEFPFTRSATGASEFRKAVAENFAAVVDQKPTIREIFSEGDKVVLFARETGVIRATGTPYDVEFVQRFTFRDGRLAAVQIIGAHARPVGD